MEIVYGKKGWWVCAIDIELIEVEVAPKQQHVIDNRGDKQNQSRKNNLHSVYWSVSQKKTWETRDPEWNLHNLD